MYKIQTITAGSAVASLDFTVPSGYDDLYLVVSARSTGSGYGIDVTINGSTANYSYRALEGNGASTFSFASGGGGPTRFFASQSDSGTTASTFGNSAIYISNYLSNTAKSISIDTVTENNGTTAFQDTIAALWNSTAAITSLSLTPQGGNNFATGTTATLYGIRKYNTTATPKATGGIITYANGYWVHTFTASGTFTPTQSLTADCLIVAGGGAGGWQGGGGGAGGFREFTGQSLSATGYTVTVGAGGANIGADFFNPGGSGTNSSFNSNSATGGGGGLGGGGGQQSKTGASGGSGGGGGGRSDPGAAGGAGNAGSYSPVEGYAGGSGTRISSNSNEPGGGGGGAGAVGVTPSSGVNPDGGIGKQSSITGTATYYAGGGGGGVYVGPLRGAGGLGGGGSAPSGVDNGNPGQVATGGGGSGSTNDGTSAGSTKYAGNGGSGVVIIRYAA